MSTNRTTDALPVIDLQAISAEISARNEIADQIDRTFREMGFCYIRNTGVDFAQVENVFAASKKFHALPQAEKDAIAINRYHRGYIAPQSSQIRGSTIESASRPNLSESFIALHEVDPSDPVFGQPLQGPNQWPDSYPAFKSILTDYRNAMTAMARKFNRLLALALSLPENYFDQHFEMPTSWLRLLHYPPQPAESPGDQYGSAPHTDHGFITLLAQDDIGGLEVRSKQGQWIAAPPIPQTFVVNVADMLARWTNGRWVSTPHRVRNLTGRERYSIPFFWDMSMDCVVDCLPGCCSDDNPTKFSPVRYGDYVVEKLDSNYAYRQSNASQ